MRYLIILCLALAGCSPAKDNKVKHFVCFNPFTPIQSFNLSTDQENVKETISYIIISGEDGSKGIIPKSLCVEVIPAVQ